MKSRALVCVPFPGPGAANSALDLTCRAVTPFAGAQRARQSGPQVSASVRQARI